MLSQKFLKNRETLIFQKLAGGDKSPPYQVAFKKAFLKATWY
jgi:hypothetical protein